MTNKSQLIKFFNEIHKDDLKSVGGKNSSLGEMYNALGKDGIQVPFGFAITTDGYWKFISHNNLREPITNILSKLDTKSFANLKETGEQIRKLMRNAVLPRDLKDEITTAYQNVCEKYGADSDVAVRSSATAEDLPFASFAGQHESFLNIQGEDALLKAVQSCYVSLFTDRAIKYREDNHFDHMSVALSAGVQKMVRADLASSGIIFTLEPESGFENIIQIAACWGLGENIVQGAVNPDEYSVFKPTFLLGKNAIVSKKLGSKAKTMVYAKTSEAENENTIVNENTSLAKQEEYVLTDAEINTLSSWSLAIEKHYGKAMDIEWAKDGKTNELFIVQARPETTHKANENFRFLEYLLNEKGKIITSGNAVGSKITSGPARVLLSPADGDKLKNGEILVTDITNPDWDPLMKKAAGIITNKGGRTSHAAIVARELGLVAVVGTENATQLISDGQMITVNCASGKIGSVYDGALSWSEREINFKKIQLPKTKPMLILGDPDKAFRFSFYPNEGIGLMRLEFIINNAIQIHPMALVNFDSLKDLNAKEKIEKLTHHYPDKKNYFVDKLAQAVATIACAFYPKDVIVRMSDFKTNEYANLLGGKEFEPKEENPMIGFRGASRYYNERYKQGFKLECLAMKKVREEMGLTNVKLMIPFCRTVEEGIKVRDVMKENGLVQGEHGLEIYMMTEIPSNVLLADQFAEIFDGFSIGSNDLTQLTLGIDRDSAIISDLFSEQNGAVKQLISTVIAAAKRNKIKIGLCGQAPSDHPEFAEFLVQQGIGSISFNPDALLKGIENMNKAEKTLSETKNQIHS